MNCDIIKDFINTNDKYARSGNIRLVKVEPGYAEGEMDITPDSMNSRGFVQGGAIFTLCDLTAAGASNSRNQGMIAMGGNITATTRNSTPNTPSISRLCSQCGAQIAESPSESRALSAPSAEESQADG